MPEMDTPSPASVRIQIAFTRGAGTSTTPQLGHAAASIATPPPHVRHETRLMVAPSAPANPRSASANRAARLERTGSIEARLGHENGMLRCAPRWELGASAGEGGGAGGGRTHVPENPG